MIIDTEAVIEGSYQYLQDNKLYSTENFKLSRRLESHAYFFEAEILSRIETGEFLKAKVYYELTPAMTPMAMRIEKSLGQKYSLETFEVRPNTNELLYEFKSDGQTQSIVRHYSNKHYLSSPAVCTSAIFTLTKKFAPEGRTPVILVAAHNSWDASDAEPSETMIYTEYNNRETVNLHLGGQELEAQCLTLFNKDSLGGRMGEDKVELMLSKHYSIPYQLITGNIQINIKNLARLD